MNWENAIDDMIGVTAARSIVHETAGYACVPVSKIMSHSREKECTTVRQVCMVRFKEELNMSASAIGRFFDRDHTAVLHAFKKLEGNYVGSKEC